MRPDEISRKSAVELVNLIKDKQLSPVELTQAVLAAIDNYNPKLNAVCTLADDISQQAENLANKATQGEFLPLHGLPFGIKDVTPTAGVRTTYGSPLYKDHVPKQDALVVSRLKKAGGILIGKTNTPEFATGGNTFNEVFGRTFNPWNPQLSAGGSTGGGAAALASGMIALAEGTDLGGSLRIPASFCGVVGLRPSPGLVPTYPSEYLWDNMQVSGPMARTAEDIALMLDAISGPSSVSPTCQPNHNRHFLKAVQQGLAKDLKAAYCPDIANIGIDSEVEKICRQGAFSLTEKALTVHEQNFDLSFARKPFLAIRGLWMVIQQYHNLDRIEEFGENLKGNVKAGLKLTTTEIAAGEHARLQMREMFYHFFQNHDYLLTPCMAVAPFPVEENFPATIAGKKMATYIDWVAPTFLLSLSGLPVASVPCGLTEAGLPVGLQIVGRPFGEESVLALAQQIQKLCPIGLPNLQQFS